MTTTTASSRDFAQQQAVATESGFRAKQTWAALVDMLGNLPGLLEDMRSFHSLQRSAHLCEQEQPVVAANLRASALKVFASR